MGNSESTDIETTVTNVTNFYMNYHVNILNDANGSLVQCLRLGLLVQEKYSTDSTQLTDNTAKAELKTALLRFAVVQAVKEQQSLGAIRHAFKILNTHHKWEINEKDFDDVIDDLITLREPATRLDNLETNLNVVCASLLVYINLFPTEHPAQTTTLTNLAEQLTAITGQMNTTKEKNDTASRAHIELNEWYKKAKVNSSVAQATPLAQVTETVPPAQVTETAPPAQVT